MLLWPVSFGIVDGRCWLIREDNQIFDKFRIIQIVMGIRLDVTEDDDFVVGS